MTPIDDDAIKQLAADCQSENMRFQREGKSDTTRCFELLRLALAELNPVALNHVYAIYIPKLQWYAVTYIGSQDIDEDPEFFAEEAFFNFYRAACGEQFEQKFKVLPNIIRFMQVCVFNKIKRYRQKNSGIVLPLTEFDFPDPHPITEGSQLEALWGRICDNLPDPNQQLLARLTLVLDMKPREIIEMDDYKKIWDTEHNVSAMLYRIRMKLRKDEVLKKWMDDV